MFKTSLSVASFDAKAFLWSEGGFGVWAQLLDVLVVDVVVLVHQEWLWCFVECVCVRVRFFSSEKC